MKFGKRHYRPQVDQMDCGVASLAMVFGYYGSYYSLAHLRELAKTTMDGTTALGLVKVAEEIGFETRAIKADMTLFDLPDLTFPFVAHVLKEGKLLHYYVVTGQDKDSIHIAIFIKLAALIIKTVAHLVTNYGANSSIVVLANSRK